MGLIKNKIISLLLVGSMVTSCTTMDANARSSFFKKTALVLGTIGFFGLAVYCCGWFYKKSRGFFSTKSLFLSSEKRKAISRALLLACENGNIEEARDILEKNNIKRRLDSLAKESNIECYKPNIFITELMDEKNRSALYLACKSGNLKLVRLLAKEIDRLGIGKGGEGIDELESKKSILEVACECDNPEIFKFLVNTFVKNVNQEDREKVFSGAPLHVACRFGKLELVKWLIEEKGANIHVGIKLEGSTPIYIASQKGYVEIVEYLVSKGADPKEIVKGGDWASSVHIACKNGHFETVRYFVEKLEVPVNLTNSCGKTLVHFAAESYNLELFKFLVKKDETLINKSYATIWYENQGKTINDRVRKRIEKKSKTPLDIAQKNGRREIAEWISKKIEKLKN